MTENWIWVLKFSVYPFRYVSQYAPPPIEINFVMPKEEFLSLSIKLYLPLTYIKVRLAV